MGEQRPQSRLVSRSGTMLVRSATLTDLLSETKAVDGQYTVALLYNNTIEVHSIHTQEITQVVTLSPANEPAETPFQPRHLYRSALGLQFGAATGAHKVDLVDVALLPAPTSAIAPRSDLPRTPTKRTSRLSVSSASVRSTVSCGAEDAAEKRSQSRILVTSRNGVYALSPMTLVVQADALLDKGRDTDALALADNYAKSVRRTSDDDDAEVEGAIETDDHELSYVYMKLAFRALAKTAWQDAFDLFRKAQCDPRIVVRLFPDLRQPFMSATDQVSVCRGVRDEVLALRTVDQYGKGEVSLVAQIQTCGILLIPVAEVQSSTASITITRLTSSPMSSPRRARPGCEPR